MVTQDYVAGFLFNEDLTKVALIRKKRPPWQAGRLNAIGGKLESMESYLAAMRREFEEETGLSGFDWKCFAVLKSKSWAVWFYWDIGNPHQCMTKTDEKIEVVSVAEAVLRSDTISNLKWLIPLAHARNVKFPVVVNYEEETDA